MLFSHKRRLMRPIVLVIGGLDPSGGAGLAADIQTVTALGAHPAPVLGLVTVQDTRRLWRAKPIGAELLVDQAEAVLNDCRVAAVKLGALGSAENGRAVADLLDRHADLPLITDPVLGATGGGRLAAAGLVKIYREKLIPRSLIATPNREEFKQLGGETALERWRVRGLGWCLVTGGDAPGDRVVHRLYGAGGRREIDVGPRRAGPFHGSGCTLASAIAAEVARGAEVEDAIAAAERFVQRSLAQAFSPGCGQALPGRWV